eukprot:m.778319 g.778319  ORF g.778319 m.778319 type:complete len:90 (-) comp23270_c0_seq31:86-355(-)
MQTLDKHRFDYAFVNVVLLFTMVARVFLVGYTIAFDLLPTVALYVEVSLTEHCRQNIAYMRESTSNTRDEPLLQQPEKSCMPLARCLCP